VRTVLSCARDQRANRDVEKRAQAVVAAAGHDEALFSDLGEDEVAGAFELLEAAASRRGRSPGRRRRSARPLSPAGLVS
jgi:hypothetical protein